MSQAEMSTTPLDGDYTVTIHIVYPWKQTMTFPCFPTGEQFYEALGESSKEWCLHRVKTGHLSFSVAEGVLAGHYDSPEALRVSPPTFATIFEPLATVVTNQVYQLMC